MANLSAAFAAARPRKGAGSAPGQGSLFARGKAGFSVKGGRCRGPDGSFASNASCGLPPAQVRSGCRDASGAFMPLPQCRRQGVAGLGGAQTANTWFLNTWSTAQNREIRGGYFDGTLAQAKVKAQMEADEHAGPEWTGYGVKVLVFDTSSKAQRPVMTIRPSKARASGVGFRVGTRVRYAHGTQTGAVTDTKLGMSGSDVEVTWDPGTTSPPGSAYNRGGVVYSIVSQRVLISSR